MAIYTKLDKAEIKNFLSLYGLDLLEHEGIVAGVQNTNYFIRTSKGKFILTVYEEAINLKDLPFFCGAMEHMYNKGIKCPCPLRSLDGKNVNPLHGKSAGLVNFLEGNFTHLITSDQCAGLGKLMAQMHVAAEDFKMTGENPLSIKGCKELYSKIYTMDTLRAGLKKEIQGEFDFVEANTPAHLPTGWIHADIFPDNVFFDGGEVSGIIDFFFSCTDSFVYDIAVTVNAWCFDGADDKWQFIDLKFKEMMAEYEKVRPLSNEEKQALPVMLRRAAVRFFLTRAYDKLYPKSGAVVGVKNPMEYACKINFFRNNVQKILALL